MFGFIFVCARTAPLHHELARAIRIQFRVTGTNARRRAGAETRTIARTRSEGSSGFKFRPTINSFGNSGLLPIGGAHVLLRGEWGGCLSNDHQIKKPALVGAGSVIALFERTAEGTTFGAAFRFMYFEALEFFALF